MLTRRELIGNGVATVTALAVTNLPDMAFADPDKLYVAEMVVKSDSIPMMGAYRWINGKWEVFYSTRTPWFFVHDREYRAFDGRPVEIVQKASKPEGIERQYPSYFYEEFSPASWIDPGWRLFIFHVDKLRRGLPQSVWAPKFGHDRQATEQYVHNLVENHLARLQAKGICNALT